MVDNKKHGKGIIYYRNRQVIKYEGEFENDIFNGTGKLEFL